MVDFSAGFQSYGVSRKVEIVKGKEFSANQTFKIAQQQQQQQPSPRSPEHPRSMRSPSPNPLQRVKRKKRFSLRFKDPEMKRQKRIAKYKLYAVEGKVKSSFSKGIRWIKNKYSVIVNGFN